MSRKSKWVVLWDQITDDPEIIGTFVIGTLLFFFELLREVLVSESVSTVTIGLGGFGLLILLSGITLYFRRAYRATKAIISGKHVPAVFVVGQPREEAEAMLRKAQETITKQTGFKEFKQLENSLNVSYRELIVHRGQRIRPEIHEWVDFIDDGQRQIRGFTDRLDGAKTYHVFIYGPSSLALGLGVAFGSKHPLIAYQYTGIEYEPVIDMSRVDRSNIKKVKNTENRHIQVEFPEALAADTAVILFIASHPPGGDVREYVKSIGKSMSIVEINSTHGGHLAEPDWTEIIQEIYSVLTRLEATEKVRRIHLFHSMPVALAFGVGMAVGNFTPITVYNWEAKESTYYPVLELNELKSEI